MIVRIFETAVEPEDVDRGREIFRRDVVPVYEAFDGCKGIEMQIGLDEHSGDLVTVVAVSRWDSMEAISAATKRPEYSAALSEIKKLFQQTPIIRHFEVDD
jgi:quinol monooxygenase YgiN